MLSATFTAFNYPLSSSNTMYGLVLDLLILGLQCASEDGGAP